MFRVLEMSHTQNCKDVCILAGWGHYVEGSIPRATFLGLDPLTYK